MNLNLHDRVVIVGGGGGRRGSIGEAIVRGLAAEGAIPVIVDRSEGGAAYAAELRAGGSDALYISADLTEPDRVRAAVRTTLDTYGRIDAVINNVGINDGVGLEGEPEDFLRSLHANLLTHWLVVKYSLAALKNSRGSVLAIGSKVAVTGQGGTNGYAAAKGGVLGLVRDWAVDLAPFGVRCNALVVAECWTPAYRDWLEGLPDGVTERRAIEDRIPLGNRMTTAREIADTAVFLISDRSSHTTGQYIHVDGGYVHLDRRVPKLPVPPAPPSPRSPAD